jgi:hypothetical protein
MNPEYLNSLVTAAAGLVAWIVYWQSKRHEKKSAAAIIVMDVRHAEQVILSLLERGAVDKSMKPILHENNWVKYQHLFATDFSYDDLSAFNRFFDSCVEIAEARRTMINIFYANLNAKISTTQAMILALDDVETPENQELRQKIIKRCNDETYAFEPHDPKIIVLTHLNLMGRPSTSLAFDKLKKIAGFGM